MELCSCVTWSSREHLLLGPAVVCGGYGGTGRPQSSGFLANCVRHKNINICMSMFVGILPSWSSLDPWVASIFLVRGKERGANGVEMHSKLGCNAQQASPCCVTLSPGEGGVVGNELRGDGGGRHSAGLSGCRRGFGCWPGLKCRTVNACEV